MPPFIQKTVYSDFTVDYLDYAHDVRGRIINSIAEMEQRIDWYIADYFCATLEKRTELMEVIISTKHLTFQAKAEILKYLLEKGGHATKNQARKIYTHLVDTIASNRNILAHCSLDTSVASLKKFQQDKETISFHKFLNVKKVVSFTKKDVRKLIELTGSISGLLLVTKSPNYSIS